MAIGDWICTDCGERLGKWPDGHVGTFHHGICDYCFKNGTVTEPRDYGYPQLPTPTDRGDKT